MTVLGGNEACTVCDLVQDLMPCSPGDRIKVVPRKGLIERVVGQEPAWPHLGFLLPLWPQGFGLIDTLQTVMPFVMSRWNQKARARDLKLNETYTL